MKQTMDDYIIGAMRFSDPISRCGGTEPDASNYWRKVLLEYKKTTPPPPQLSLASYKAELRGEINKWRMEALSAPPAEFWKGKFVAFNQVKALLEDNPTEK